MNKIRDFFGFQKESIDWDKEDIKIIFISILFYMIMAAIPYIIKSNEDINGNKIISIILVMLALYNFIAFIIISIKINRKG